jgi:hypothetical protein
MAGLVSTIGLKQLAQRLLPSSSLTRSLILSQPDSMPDEEWRAKSDILVQALYAEVQRLRT